jgi:signal transduction histidine kinase
MRGAGPGGYARRMNAAPRPPLLKRVPPGAWMTISWCAVIAYVGGPVMLFAPGRPLWHQVLLGVPILIWAGLVVALSAVLLRRWPLPALGLLLAAVIAAASAPQTAQSNAPASYLIAPAGVAVGYIAATASRRVSATAAVIALGVLARYGTNFRGEGLTADCWPAAVVIAWLIGHSIRQHRLHAGTLRAQAEAAAATAERLRIAGELHDMVAHAIGVIAIQAGAGSQVIDTQPAQARNALVAIEATSRQTLAGVRRALGALRRAEPRQEPGQAPPGPVPPGAALSPPLLRPVPPGVGMAVSWCAVTAYVISAVVLEEGGLPVLTTRRPHLVPPDMTAVPWPLLATAGVVALSAVLLRRWPWPALALLLVGAIAAAMMPEPQLSFLQLALQPPAFFLIAPAGVAVGFIAATRPRPVSAGAAVIALGVQACYAGGAMPTGFSPRISPVLAVAVATVIAWLIGQSIRQNRLHAQTLRTQAEAEAVTAERLRLARELHDMIAHSIGVIAIQAGAGSEVIDTQPAEARNVLIAIEVTSRQALAELRRTLGAPGAVGPGPDLARSPLGPAPGLADIAQLAATAMGAGVRVDVRWRGQRRPLPADIDQSAFRIIQEAVTNVIRHARTGHCQVTIDQHQDQVAIEVTDHGRGGAGNGTGYGIAGMRERAGLLGGQLSAGPRPEGGFTVAARLPLPLPVPAAAR